MKAIGRIALSLSLLGLHPLDAQETGGAVIDRLLDDLDGPDEGVRHAAVCGLADMGVAGERAVPKLILLLKREVEQAATADPVPWTCPFPRRGWLDEATIQRTLRSGYFVAWALRELHGAELAVDSVMRMTHTRSGARLNPRSTAVLLGALGPEAVPALARWIDRSEPLAKRLAVLSLPLIDPLTKGAVDALEHAVVTTTGEVQGEAVRALSEARARIAP